LTEEEYAEFSERVTLCKMSQPLLSKPISGPRSGRPCKA
jgi:hypothetical protein